MPARPVPADQGRVQRQPPEHGWRRRVLWATLPGPASRCAAGRFGAPAAYSGFWRRAVPGRCGGSSGVLRLRWRGWCCTDLAAAAPAMSGMNSIGTPREALNPSFGTRRWFGRDQLNGRGPSSLAALNVRSVSRRHSRSCVRLVRQESPATARKARAPTYSLTAAGEEGRPQTSEGIATGCVEPERTERLARNG